MTEERSLLTPELRALIGTAVGEKRFTVEPLVAARLAEALGLDPETAAEADSAPAYYCPAFETSQASIRLPGGPDSGVLAGDEWEQRRPLRWGERITGRGVIAGIDERFGKNGQMLHVRHEWTFRDEAGEIVGISRRIYVRYGSAGGADADEEAP